MGYQRPSRGCQRCRRMKKKCDQKLPGCQRCEKIGIICPGYRDEGDIIFRDESDNTRFRVESSTSRGSMKKSPSGQLVKSDSPEALSTGRRTASLKTPSSSPAWFDEGEIIITPPSLRLVFDSQFGTNPNHNDLISFFFTQFVFPAQKSNWPGWLRLLPQMYTSAPDDSCLRPTVLAAASAILASRMNNAVYFKQAMQLYALALQTVQKALAGKDMGNETLMSVSLLDTFQYIIDERTESFGSHSKGIKALLQIKAQAEPRKLPQDLIQLAVWPNISALCGDLRLHKHPSPSSRTWISGFYHPWARKWPSERVAVTIFEITELVAKMTDLYTFIREMESQGWLEVEIEEQREQLISTIKEAQELDKRTCGWSGEYEEVELERRREANPEERSKLEVSSPRSKAEERVLTSPCLGLTAMHVESRWLVKHATTSHTSPEGKLGNLEVEVDYYTDLWAACVWNSYRASRIILHDTILNSLSSLSPTTSTSASTFSTEYESLLEWNSRDIIAALVRDIRASIPFILGQVSSAGEFLSERQPTALGGQGLVWPLNVLQGIKNLDESQREWASRMLIELGSVTGVRRAWRVVRDNGTGGEGWKGKGKGKEKEIPVRFAMSVG